MPALSTSGWTHVGSNWVYQMQSAVDYLDNLYIRYTMDNVSGTTLVDEKGNVNGILNGSPNFIPGVTGNAVECDSGKNVTFSISSSNIKSISMWVKVIENISSICILGSTGGNNYYPLRYNAITTMAMYIGGGWSNDVTVPDGTLKFYHTVLNCVDGSNTDLYIDGEKKGTLTKGMCDLGALGLCNVGPQYYGHVAIDDFRVYSTLLTDTQIKQIYYSKQ